MPSSRRAEALDLAEELLSDIEYARLGPPEVAKKASRLARLLDDDEALRWLRYEVGGYTPLDRGHMTADETVAAIRSRRRMADEEGEARYNISSLSWLQASVDAAQTALAASGGGPSSSQFALPVENARIAAVNEQRSTLATVRARVDAIVGAIYDYVLERHQELRFGGTVESAFERVRHVVDRDIASVAPNALTRLSAAFENAESESPEHWANAASTCRRLIKEVADALRPAGPDVGGIKMGQENYINRLVDWVTNQPVSETARDVVTSDLEFLGRRLDAVVDAGHKGTHAEVSRYDASRFLVSTYLVLGDVIGLGAVAEAIPEAAQPAGIELADEPLGLGLQIAPGEKRPGPAEPTDS